MALTLKTFFVCLVLGSLVAVLAGIAMQDNLGFYGITPDPIYGNVTNEFNGTLTSYNDFAKKFQERVEGEEGTTVVGTLITITAGAFQILKLPFDLMKLTTTMISSTLGILGIPDIFIFAMVTLILGVIAFITIGVLFSKEA